MSEQCVKHHLDMAEGRCRHCGYSFCSRCLVFAKGPTKPPYCLNCAMAAAGVRSSAANRPIASKAELRRLERDRRRAERAEAKAQRRAPETRTDEVPPPGVIPAPRYPVPSRSPAAGWGHTS